MSVPTHFGRYRVLRPLATGEMGIVYLAEDPLIGRQLAIKGIRFDDHSDDDEIRRLQARFDQEIQIAGTFSHPNIVTLYDVGRQGARSYIAMEYIDGRNLRAELQASGPLSTASAIALIAPVCCALNYAHDRGIIHRDIKPTNILVSSEGVPKITDFGVARLFGSTLTNAGKIFGTPAYMSPEQARGTKLSGASDQFAVAAVLYELLTGERPFKGTSPTAVIYEVIESDPPPPHEIRPLVPTAVGKVVMRGLAKAPDERFESCAALADALEAALAWSQANPELAYLETRQPEAPPKTSPTVRSWGATPLTLWERARQAAANAASSDVWRQGRALAVRISADSRSLAVFTGGALSLIVLITVVAWAASSGGAGPRLPSANEQPELLASVDHPDRGMPRTGTPRRANGGPAAEGTGSTTLAAASELEPGNRGSDSFVVVTRPPGARVLLDGEVLADTSPVSLRLADDERHTLRLEREGYEPLAWAFSRDQLSARHLASGELYFPLNPLAEPDGIATAPGETTIEIPASIVDTAALSPAAEPVWEDAWAGYGISGPPPSPADVRRVRAPAQAPTPEKLRHVDLELPSTLPATGVVVIEIEVSARGNVVQAKILRGIDARTNQAALDAVVRWKYRPTTLAGEPVHVVMTVTLPIGPPDRR